MAQSRQCGLLPDLLHPNAYGFRQLGSGRGGQEASEAAIGTVAATAAAITVQIAVVLHGINADIVQVIDVHISAGIAHIGQPMEGCGHQPSGEHALWLPQGSGRCHRYSVARSSRRGCRGRGLRQSVILEIAVDVLVHAE